MKIVITLFFLLGILVFKSCIVDRVAVSNNKIYINNKTSYTIKFLPYKNGLVIIDNIKTFLPNTINFLEDFKYSGPYPGVPYLPDRFRFGADSIIVVFNTDKKEKHQLFPGSPITFLPNIQRSLYSAESSVYKQNIIEQRKGYIETEFTYTFTEQDYIDAEPIN